METAVSCSLPPEILDLILDHLHDEPTALKVCCLVSKPWVRRARRHLFDNVEFHPLEPRSLESWMKAFPDPSNSPVHHTRSLSIHGLPDIVASTDARPWVHSFHRISKLTVDTILWRMARGSVREFRGLSPALKSLVLNHTSIELSEVFDLICSFPLLEDLSLRILSTKSDTDEWTAPSTSPKLTGSLHLSDRIRPASRVLLTLPGGLHFVKVTICCSINDANSAMGLVTRCSDTLESLFIYYYFSSAFPSTSVVDQHLTTIREPSHTQEATSA
jgi:hypothetical protein